MTTKLKPATKLVETLNELFGRFDDASEVILSSVIDGCVNTRLFFLGIQRAQDKIPG